MSAPSVRQLARKSEVIISCLPNDAAVLSVYQGPEGVIACANPGSIVIEMSTVSPDTSRVLHRMGKERGIDVLDVAISGSTPAAEAGTLTLLGGGEATVFEACQPIFAAIAKQYFLMGPSGSGTSMKLVVNALLGVNMQAIAEAVAFGEKAGPRSRPPAERAFQDRGDFAGTSEQAASRRARRLLASISAPPHEQGLQIDSR